LDGPKELGRQKKTKFQRPQWGRDRRGGKPLGEFFSWNLGEGRRGRRSFNGGWGGRRGGDMAGEIRERAYLLWGATTKAKQ